jgi:hypothetical protein
LDCANAPIGHAIPRRTIGNIKNRDTLIGRPFR